MSSNFRFRLLLLIFTGLLHCGCERAEEMIKEGPDSLSSQRYSYKNINERRDNSFTIMLLGGDSLYLNLSSSHNPKGAVLLQDIGSGDTVIYWRTSSGQSYSFGYTNTDLVMPALFFLSFLDSTGGKNKGMATDNNRDMVHVTWTMNLQDTVAAMIRTIDK